MLAESGAGCADYAHLPCHVFREATWFPLTPWPSGRMIGCLATVLSLCLGGGVDWTCRGCHDVWQIDRLMHVTMYGLDNAN